MFFTDAIGIVYGFFLPNDHHQRPPMTGAVIDRVGEVIKDVFPEHEAEKWVERAKEDDERAGELLLWLLQSGEQSVIKHSRAYWNGTLFFIDGGWIKDGTGGQMPASREGNPIQISHALLMGTMRLKDHDKEMMDVISSALGVDADWVIFQAKQEDRLS